MNTNSTNIEGEHQENEILHTVDKTLFILISFTVLLLFVWWMYTVYWSTSADTEPSPKESASQSTESNTKTQHDNVIETAMYNQTTSIKKNLSHLTKPVIMRKPKLLCTISIFLSSLYLVLNMLIWTLYPNADDGKSELHNDRTDKRARVGNTFETHCALSALSFGVVTLSRYFMYLYYVERIRIVFDGSVFALTEWKCKAVIVHQYWAYRVCIILYCDPNDVHVSLGNVLLCGVICHCQ
eukprot:1021265_1